MDKKITSMVTYHYGVITWMRKPFEQILRVLLDRWLEFLALRRPVNHSYESHSLCVEMAV